MRRLLPILAASFAALPGGAEAQQIVIRRAEAAKAEQIVGETFELSLPAGTFRKSLSGSWLTRSSSQPLDFIYKPFPDTPVSVVYHAEAVVEDGFGNGLSPGWSQYVGYRQRPAVVANATETTSFEAAVEHLTRFDRASNMETVRKAELTGKTAALRGLTFSATTGRSESDDFSSVVRDQSYGRLWAEQQLPLLPVKISLAPYLARENTRDVADSDRWISGWDSALAIHVLEPTTVSFGTNQTAGAGISSDNSSAWSSYYSQIEQQLAPGTSVKLKAGYESYDLNSQRRSESVVLGAESSFSITDSINGGIQLRHRAVQFMREAGDALPETILSLSLGGSF